MEPQFITGFSFKSETTKGNLSKTYVYTYDNDTIMICRRILLDKKTDTNVVLREYKGKFLIEEVMAFRLNSFFNIAHEVSKQIM